MELLSRGLGGLLLLSLVCGGLTSQRDPTTTSMPKGHITGSRERSTTSPNQFPRRCQEGFWGPSCGEPCRCGPNSLECDRHEGCICRPGWQGRHCEKPFSACAVYKPYRPCRWNHERCVDTSPGQYQCVCSEGFTRGEEGQCVCDANHYGRECEKLCSCGPNSLRCDRDEGCICKDGWEGHHCRENIDECLTLEPACKGQHERCVDTQGSFECTCQEGYRYREVPGIDLRRCVSDATTHPTRKERRTTPPSQGVCPRNHWGRNCDKLCRCSEMSVRCDRYEGCVCKQGWAGQYCTDFTGRNPSPQPTMPKWQWPCPKNYWGRNCDKLCTCSEMAIGCTRYDGCVCKQGWTGRHCTEGIGRPPPPTRNPPWKTETPLVQAEGGWIRVHASVFYVMLAGSVVGILSTLSLIFCMICGCSSSQPNKGPSNKDKAIVAYAALEEDAVFSIKAKGTQKY